MAKSKPIGVRFDLDMLEAMAEDKIADSPQKALNFLSSFWNERRDKINFSEKFSDLKLKKEPVAAPKKEEPKEEKKKQPVHPKNDPREGSMAFFSKYGVSTYAELKNKQE